MSMYVLKQNLYSFSVAAPPPNVTLVQGLSSTTILVRWQAPPSSSLPGTLVGYVVRYRTGSDPYSNKSVNR